MSTVLIVDDMAIFREPIAASLQFAGYRTLSAADGHEALDMVRAHRPDLILLDLAMPGMDGLEVLRHLRASPVGRDLPVLVVSAVQDRGRVVQAAQMGIRGFMLKSQFSLRELLAKVQACLRPKDPPVAAAAPVASPVPPAPSKPSEAALPPSPPPAPVPSELPRSVPAADALRELKPIVVRSEMNALLEGDEELKALSPTVNQILSLTASPNCSLDQVAKVIRQDHAIALRILKLANSVVYTRGDAVESVHKAVGRIGLNQIRQAVLNISVIDRFSSGAAAEYLDMLQFWHHSIACGLIAAEVCHGLGGKPAEVDGAFTMGLLHDVGRLVYAERLGDRYLRVLHTARELKLPLDLVESRLLLINHADLMDRLLHTWKFAQNLTNPIAFHHLSLGNMRRMSPRAVTESATLALANHVAHALLLGNSGDQVIHPFEEFAQALKLPPDVLQRVQAQVPGQSDDMKLSMVAKSHQAGVPSTRELVRAQLKAPLRPLCVSAEPDFDAYRLLCDTLREGADQPNLAVVYISHVRHRASLSEKLRAAEREAQVKDLPLIIASPAGAISLDERLATGRRVVRLSAPTPLARFLDSVNALLQ